MSTKSFDAVPSFPFTIPGAEGQPILGDTQVPDGNPRGVVVIAHGFKGYKDYGMFPRIAAAMAREGFIAHRFNFSHSGMTNQLETFARPDLFERDTWSKQVFDLRAVIEAVGADGLIERVKKEPSPRPSPGGRGGLPYVLFGHSRGGVSVLLTAGRYANDPACPQPAGIITASAPASTDNLSDDEKRVLRASGFLESPSSRTGQRLRVGRASLEEMEENPQAHDLRELIGRIRAPILIVHGEDDPTVPVEAADQIAGAARDAEVVRIPGGDHVFNTPNPMPASAEPSPQLRMLLEVMGRFVTECCAG